MPDSFPDTNACRVCGREASFVFAAADTHGRHVQDANAAWPVYACPHCDALSLGGVVVDEAYYARHYPEQYHGETGVTAASRAVGMLARRSARRKAALLLRHVSARPVRLLDVGCGSGEFLAALPGDGFVRRGLERHPRGCVLCRSKGIEVLEGGLEEVAREHTERYDAVTMLHVLEHMPDPAAALRLAAGLLAPGGALLVAVPNRRSLGLRLGGRWWFHLDSPRHLFIPSPGTMEVLAGQCGLRVAETVSGGWDYPLDLLWSVRRSWLLPLCALAYPVCKSLSRETFLAVLVKE